jgi:hypothetical protein
MNKFLTQNSEKIFELYFSSLQPVAISSEQDDAAFGVFANEL